MTKRTATTNRTFDAKDENTDTLGKRSKLICAYLYRNNVMCVAERNDNHLRSVVKIECGRNEGTAICVHSSDGVGHIFLTCAHVVQHVRNEWFIIDGFIILLHFEKLFLFFWQKTQSVILHHGGRVIKGAVIYATNKNVPHDIAVIVTGWTADITPCTISDTIPTVGEVKNTNRFIVIKYCLNSWGYSCYCYTYSQRWDIN